MMGIVWAGSMNMIRSPAVQIVPFIMSIEWLVSCSLSGSNICYFSIISFHASSINVISCSGVITLPWFPMSWWPLCLLTGIYTGTIDFSWSFCVIFLPVILPFKWSSFARILWWPTWFMMIIEVDSISLTRCFGFWSMPFILSFKRSRIDVIWSPRVRFLPAALSPIWSSFFWIFWWPPWFVLAIGAIRISLTRCSGSCHSFFTSYDLGFMLSKAFVSDFCQPCCPWEDIVSSSEPIWRLLTLEPEWLVRLSCKSRKRKTF